LFCQLLRYAQRPEAEEAMTRRTLLAILLLLAAADAAAGERATVILGATVLDGTGRAPVEDAAIVIHQGRIVAVGPRTEVPLPDDADTIDATGRWVVPGLVDAHVHFFQSAGLYTRPDIIDLRPVTPYEVEVEGLRSRLQETFRRTLAAGVTAVVDVGGPFWNFEVRKTASEMDDAPRVAVAGPLISTVSRPQLDLGDPPIIEATSVEHARKLVRAQLPHNPDLIKIWYILPPSGNPEENLPIVKAVIAEAHKAKRRVAVHATQLETARAAVKAGADILVHSVDDEPVDDAFVELLLERKTLYVTTLVVYEGYAEVLGGRPELTDVERELGDPVAIRSWEELPPTDDPAEKERREARVEKLRSRRQTMFANLKRVHAAGVTVAAGTDAGNIGTLHGASMHRELELMVEAGLSPMAILVAATRDAARVFSPLPTFGTVEPGKVADLLILDADPLADLRNLRRIHAVVKEGRPFRPDDLVPPSPETVVQRQVDAYNARDLDAFVDFYTEDVEICRLPALEVNLQGREALRARYGPFFEATPDLHCRVMKRTVSGNYVVDHEFVTGIADRPRLRAVAVYQVEGPRIRRVWFLPKE
jgi:imidazolonepropionase-like amidohydrolase